MNASNNMTPSIKIRRTGRWLATLGIVALQLVAAGCHHEPSLVGEWKGTTTQGMFQSEMDIRFNEDGTCKNSFTLMKDGRGVLVTDYGTWKLTGRKFTRTVTDMDWEPQNEPPATAAKMKARFAQHKAKIIAGSNKDNVDTLVWTDADHIVLNSKDSVKLQRVQ